MLQCLPPQSPTISPSAAAHDSQIYLHQPPIQVENPTDVTPISSAQPSPTLNLSRVYTTIVHTDSYKEMWSITRSMDPENSNHRMMLNRVLQPNREHVLDALANAKPNVPTSLISSYFDHSEETTIVCLNHLSSVDEARRLYEPLHTLVKDLPIDSLSQSHCDLVFEELIKLEGGPNPFFPHPDSHTFGKIGGLCSDLKRQLERRLRKSSSGIRLVRHASAGSAICCIGAGCTAYIPAKFARRELAHLAQLKVAEMNTHFLKIDLDTLDRLVDRLHNAVDGDKRAIRNGLRIGTDRKTIQEILKELGKNQQHLVHDLALLEEKICNCFTSVNHSRSQLLKQISLHQT